MPRQNLNGVRVHCIVPTQQEVALKKLSAKTGLTVSEHVRRAISFYLASAAEKTTRTPR